MDLLWLKKLRACLLWVWNGNWWLLCYYLDNKLSGSINGIFFFITPHLFPLSTLRPQTERALNHSVYLVIWTYASSRIIRFTMTVLVNFLNRFFRMSLSIFSLCVNFLQFLVLTVYICSSIGLFPRSIKNYIDTCCGCCKPLKLSLSFI